MTPAASSPIATSGRSLRGGRLQGFLAIASLVLAVLVTVVLVATPASSVGSGPSSSASSASTGVASVLPEGLRVEVRGGAPIHAYALADRLTGAGASVRRVDPAASDEAVPGRTAVVYYDRRAMPAAEQVRSLLGAGTLQRRQVFQPDVDVTIVLGKDLPRL